MPSSIRATEEKASRRSPDKHGGAARPSSKVSIDELSSALNSLALPDDEQEPVNQFHKFLHKNADLVDFVANVIDPSVSNQQAAHIDLDAYVPHVQRFCARWQVSKRAEQNHLKLANGLRNIPCILLQNPTRTHDMAFDDMVENTATLRYLQDSLDDNGLSLDDVIILDAIPLLTDRDLYRLSTDERRIALFEASELTRRFIRINKVSVIVSLQCATQNNAKYDGISSFLRELGSSTKWARMETVMKTSIDGRALYVVQGFHPGHIIRTYKPDLRIKRERILQNILEQVYSPYAEWISEMAREEFSKSRKRLDCSANKFLNDLERALAAMQKLEALQTTVSPDIVIKGKDTRKQVLRVMKLMDNARSILEAN
ncbi:hypothetical protein MGYG_02293 [Nannizzia gypsea CBS 118893]|uniref:Uncharacterized protein n=1 Tax=Arthroderma gypseum (strain ATCC MYA-4604 / CBS 118893) TaxID=535722 RepID=E4UQV4_ARTGP|nr:hypothetical protein MGYG_02293 [Nannizzia gypsea CBS 118893]EFQ99280.1 hypothetical protein MGYG_02293 [Nannizzia gypsea CBS 118893]